jgi:hypothetical protein
VRGGLNTSERISHGSGVWTDEAGNVHDVSVNSAAVKTIEELARGIPNKQIGVTTVGRIRAAGGDIVRNPSRSNPYHCLVSGLSADALSRLPTPTIPNPSC